MKNFKIKDLMISIHPHSYSGQYMHDHFKMGDPAPDCMGSVSKCGKTKEDCDATSKCVKTKNDDCEDNVSSCKKTKTGPPDYYNADSSLMQDEESTYSKDLWNLKQALARMKAKELPL